MLGVLKNDAGLPGYMAIRVYSPPGKAFEYNIHHQFPSCIYLNLDDNACTLPLINSLPPRHAIRRKFNGSTVAEIMACCLTAPSYSQ